MRLRGTRALVPALWLGSAAIALLACAPSSRLASHVPPARSIDAERWLAGASWLAAPEREGRGLDGEGLAASARYLADAFRQAGLSPAGDDGGYLQAFEAPVSLKVREASLRVGATPRVRGEDFAPLAVSESGIAEGAPVFVGYGISDESSGWDDYDDAPVQGRIVVVLEGTPPGDALGPHPGAFGLRSYKLLNARRHGARAVLLAPPEPDASAGDPEGPMGANPVRTPAGVLATLVSGRLAEELARASHTSWRTVVAEANAAAGWRELAGTPLRLEIQVERRTGRVANVVGRLPGADPARAGEAVLIGAHYDHLGRGAFGSMAPDRRGEVHPGADDNASGAAGLAALARAFATSPRPARSLLFVAFTGEEAGLLGSGHYVEAPVVPLADTVAMINLDMIGRLRDEGVTVFGADTAAGFEALVRRAADDLGLPLTFSASGAFGPSDHASFTAKEIPSLFLFTGTHPQYHTPDDTPDLLNAEGAARVLALAGRLAEALADAPDRPAFVGEKPRGHGGPPSDVGYGPYLGTVPSFGGPAVRGVRLAAVRAGSPAEAAGLRAGDVIVRFADTDVASLEDLAALLFTRRPSDRVEIVVEREGERVTTEAELGRRR